MKRSQFLSSKKQVHSRRIKTLVFASSGNITLASLEVHFAQVSTSAPLSPGIPVSAVSEAQAVSMEFALLEHSTLWPATAKHRGNFSRQWLLMTW